MQVTVFQCGPAANDSERKAVERLRRGLQAELGDGVWILLANLSFSVTHRLQSDEIDIVAIGPPGARVIEVKHWADRHRPLLDDEADRVANKARKIGTTLRNRASDLPYVDGAILVTQEASRARKLAAAGPVRGIGVHTLAGWKDAIGLDKPDVLSPARVRALAEALAPKAQAAADGTLKRLAGYADLTLRSRREERFHRVYKAVHATRRDRAILHLYDLSLSAGGDGRAARRGYEAIHRLQRHAWAPRILDTWQDAPGYAGEMYFFAIADPAAPTLAERANDESWPPEARAHFARNAVRALETLHEGGADGDGPEAMLHRSLTPRTLLVKHDNSPILTAFEWTRISAQHSVAPAARGAAETDPFAAPEVRAQGLGAADRRSDVYSLCSALREAFAGRDDETSRSVAAILDRGARDAPEERPALCALDEALSALLGDPLPPPRPPPVRYWSEGQEFRFGDHDYRVVEKLGAGGVGAAFKIVRIDRTADEDLGTFVAKVAHNERDGAAVLRAYRRAQPVLGRNAALSAIFEIASEWRENEAIALMSWVDGGALHDYAGVFPLLAADLDMAAEALALRWLRALCGGLDVLHRNGLVHGDVSPRNMIVSGEEIVLTDYDFVCRIGEPAASPGTALYCPPPRGEAETASASNDIYALAASFFHVIFEREPFACGGVIAKERGLAWDGANREEYPVLAEFLDKATHPDPARRFSSAAGALAMLAPPPPAEEPGAAPAPGAHATPVLSAPRTENEVEWLRSLLQSYPGSRYGNRETRGLDSDFAARTYVPTNLENALYRDIRERRIRLAILCGNAGDGKTALLQHLAKRLGLPAGTSSERIVQGGAEGGPAVKMNLDGSAAWRGRSANELLDEFMAPFRDGRPNGDIAHLLAVNDGRLLEWTERAGDTQLTDALYRFIDGEAVGDAPHIRFIDLNERSLVGRVTPERDRIETDFLHRLLDALYGDGEAADIWKPCGACSAQERCEVFRAARLFGPEGIPDMAEDDKRGRARERLFKALQAVHLRGETHITMRELRGALVYILFGTRYCPDYHDGRTEPPYWNRAFSADSPNRQGEILAELIRLDPALESHPWVDRLLVRDDAAADLPSARRRAYFERSGHDIANATGDLPTVGLAGGKYLGAFRGLALSADVNRADALRDRICRGISRLDGIPPGLLRRQGVPLRIVPRTPTETGFWVEKPLDSFRLEADLQLSDDGMDRLHRQATLAYRYSDGRDERLQLGAALFHILMELGDGYQLGDASTDDTFAQLSIFVQRLLRENNRELTAWSPLRDESAYDISLKFIERDGDIKQVLHINAWTDGDAE